MKLVKVLYERPSFSRTRRGSARLRSRRAGNWRAPARGSRGGRRAAEVEPGAQHRVRLVGRSSTSCARRPVEVARTHARVGARLFQSPNSSSSSAREPSGSKSPTAENSAVGRAEEVAVEAARLSSVACCAATRCAPPGRARSTGGPWDRREWRASGRLASADGSVRCASAPVSAARFSSSNSCGEARARAAPRRPGAAPAADSRARVSMRCAPVAAVTADAGLQLVEVVLDLLARLLLRAAHQHARRRSCARPRGSARLFSSPKRSVSVATTRPAARLLGQQRRLHAARRAAALHARLDVRGRGVEGLARRRLRRRPCSPRARLPRPARAGSRRGRASSVGMNSPSVRLRASGTCSATRCTSSGVTASRRSRWRKNRRQSPMRGPLGQRARAGRRVVELRLLEVLQQRGRARSTSSGVDGSLAEALHGRRAARRAPRRASAVLRAPRRRSTTKPGSCSCRARSRRAARRELRLDQRLVQAARGRVAEHVGQHVDRRRSRDGGRRARGRRRARSGCRRRAAASPRARRPASAPRCRGRQRARRASGSCPKCFATSASARRLVELARRRSAPRCRAGTRCGRRPAAARSARSRCRRAADGRVAVVVPEVGELLHALEQHARRVVLAHLELVAHHRHLAVEVLFATTKRVHHAVGFQAERPVEVRRRWRRRSRSSWCGRTRWCRWARAAARRAPA